MKPEAFVEVQPKTILFLRPIVEPRRNGEARSYLTLKLFGGKTIMRSEASLDFTALRFGQGPNKLNALWHFEVFKVPPAVDPDLLWRESLPLLQDNLCLDGVAQNRIRDANHADFGDSVKSIDDVLDLNGTDFLASAIDQLLRPSNKMEMPVLVHREWVPRARHPSLLDTNLAPRIEGLMRNMVAKLHRPHQGLPRKVLPACSEASEPSWMARSALF